MRTFLRFLEFLAIGVWLGSELFFSLVVAQGAFRILSSRDQAGAMVGFALGHLHLVGIFCGLLFLVATLLRTGSFASLTSVSSLCVALMIVLTAVSQYVVSARMATLRTHMGSIQATAADSPLLAEFSRLHRISVSLEGAVMLVGFAALYLMVRELARVSS